MDNHGRTVTVSRVAEWLAALAPAGFKEEWDPAGLEVGDPGQPVERILVALSPTRPVVEEALELRADLLVTHHPLLFRPAASLRVDEPTGGKVAALLRGGCSLLSLHTAFDRAPGGMNDLLAASLGLAGVCAVPDPAGPGAGQGERQGSAGLGRIGTLPRPVPLDDLARQVAARLGLPGVRRVGPPARNVQRVACVAGAGAAWIPAAVAAGADVLVTGDVKYHAALDALEAGLALLDAGHYGTERLFTRAVVSRVEEEARKAGYPLLVQASGREADPLAWVQVDSHSATVLP